MKKSVVILTIALMLPAVTFAAPKKRQTALNAAELIEQTRQAIDEYNPEKASGLISKLRSIRNLSDEYEVNALEARADRMAAMMQRVDAIEVIDSLTVNRDDFFAAYRLSPAAGFVLSPADLGEDFKAKPASTVYMSENGSVMIWATGSGLVESHRLTDGTWEAGQPLSDALNGGGVANYPFLMPDGITLYYATEGDDSLGGYDIYVSRRNGEEFPTPQNMGMPYNSPYDDFLLAIDEETGAGWFASDRNSPGGDVTVYVFVPSDSRVNVDVDDPMLAARARLADISLSQSGEDHQPLLDRINSIEPGGGMADNTPDFEFVLPDGRVLTRWDDFRSDRARRLMENYVDALADYNAEEAALEKMRSKFNRADRNAASRILSAEKKIMTSREQLKSLSNRIIEAELR